MSVLDTLITDRTQNDVNTLKDLRSLIILKGWNGITQEQRNAFLLTQKGAYNSTDMNRVGNAVTYVATEMSGQETLIRNYCNSVGVEYTSEFAVPYDIPTVSGVKTDYVVGDLPTNAQLSTYLGNLQEIKDCFDGVTYEGVVINLPEIPSTMSALNYSKANNMEQLLISVDSVVWQIYAKIIEKIQRTANGFIYSGTDYAEGY